MVASAARQTGRCYPLTLILSPKGRGDFAETTRRAGPFDSAQDRQAQHDRRGKYYPLTVILCRLSTARGFSSDSIPPKGEERPRRRGVPPEAGKPTGWNMAPKTVAARKKVFLENEPKFSQAGVEN